MTQPKISTIKRGGSRLYVHPETADKVPGVTSVLDMLPKGFLKFWAAKVVAETAVNDLGAVVSIAMRDPQGAIDYLKRAPMRNTSEAADNGTDVHALFETLAKGEDPGRIHPDLEPYRALFEGFVEQFHPEFLFIEETVWSETHGYAGSFDFIAIITDPDTGEKMTVIGDWKTTRSGVHEEVALQETAYSRADYIIRADGTKVPLPKLDGGIVVHVRPEGGQVVPARLGDDLFEKFLALKEVWDYERNVKATTLGDGIPILPVTPPEKPTRARRKVS